MLLLGVDLAWGTRARTGLAAVDEAGGLVELTTLRTDDEILGWLRPRMEEGCLVAFDAPLIVRNDTGMRDCERLVGRYFGRFGIGCHAANRSMPVFADGGRAARLARELSLDVAPASTARRRAIEVYPHPAIVQLFELDSALRYKQKPGRDLELLRHELVRLLDHLESLEAADPPLALRRHPAWGQVRRSVAAARRKTQLRAVEDAVDAVVCAYVALLAHLRPDRVRVLGGTDGYLVVPADPERAHRTGGRTTYCSTADWKLRSIHGRRPQTSM
ncbi:MAG: DUF429 domain-containing protein [Actinomycetota bacterium]